MTTDASTSGVHTTVNYVRNRALAHEPDLTFVTEDENLSTMRVLPGTPVFVTDARDAVANGRKFDLDIEGFGLFATTSSIADFNQIEEDPTVDRCYEEGVVARLREITDAALLHSLGQPKKRYGETASDRLTGLFNAKPARFPHADFRNKVAANHARVLCPEHSGQFRRYAIYNIWQVTNSPPQDIPLAVCAANTVLPTDELPVTVVTSTRVNHSVKAPIVSYTANPDHRWYYYRGMTPDELLVFKGFDSDPNRASRVPHSAFSDPSCPKGTPTRSSIELRVMAFFE